MLTPKYNYFNVIDKYTIIKISLPAGTITMKKKLNK
jgi:hypothetical protein